MVQWPTMSGMHAISASPAKVRKYTLRAAQKLINDKWQKVARVRTKHAKVFGFKSITITFE